MKEIRILHHYHSGGNCHYFQRVLDSMGKGFSCEVVKPWPFLAMKDLSGYDVLVYQTFPDEHHRRKFNPEVIKQLDAHFLEFEGLKILLDSFDQGEMDAYTRFNGQYPRIKHIPTKEYREKFDVILSTSVGIPKLFDEIPEEVNRDVMIHCAFNTRCYPHRMRETVLKMLERNYREVSCFDRISFKNYGEFLKRVNISVTAQGFGVSGAAARSLQAGALLFTDGYVNTIELLPNEVKLIDGEDYVSYTLEDFTTKLDWLLNDSQARDRIRKSGQKKCFEGYDWRKSAVTFGNYLREKVG